ncbi:DUF4886 domain-containing protein [Taibaiella soli]|uniref:PKD domain-containing protein n=1 Tax=Taibaiella soli TaxID=1649169 RepID=A0A2W2ASD0_9BACT|nr:DUF4886 domain-containing protein [Taibaiella soli]PZF70894.1 hypothetical protein DN068_20935 [Taibaiella soli]
MKRTPVYILLCLLLFAGSAFATKRKVLFIGNSYMYTNDLPGVLQQLAASMGDTLEYDQNTVGGQTLEGHSTDNTTISKIFSQPWDIVVLQEQSQRPAFPPAQVASDTYPFAHKLDSMVKANNACSETFFFMTWGYQNGDASNCNFYPVICTYAGMQQRLRESYMQMAQDNNASVFPVGVAWKKVRDSFPAINLYNPDQSHPSLEGTYLAACVYYASIYHKSPLNSTYTAGLNAATTQNLQRIGGNTVLDSMEQWQQHGNYPLARFTQQQQGSTVNFTNQSLRATTWLWSFGDNATSMLQNPTHTYASNGTFEVALNANNGCVSESYKTTITTGSTSVAELNKDKNIIVSSYNHYLRVSNPQQQKATLVLFNAAGQIAGRYEINASTHSWPLSTAVGIYYYRVIGNDGTPLAAGSLVN